MTNQIGGGSSIEQWNHDLTEHGDRDGQPEHYYTSDDPTPFPGNKFPPDFIQHLHQQSDLDSSTYAQHHTLGTGKNNASPGNHTHDGSNSSDISALIAAALGQLHDYAGAGTSWHSDGTQPSFGSNSIVSGRYLKIGKFFYYGLSVSFGSTATYGTGNYRFTVPFAMAPRGLVSVNGICMGGATGLKAGTGNAHGGLIQFDANNIEVVSHLAGTPWGQTAPFTWASGNLLSFFVIGESQT